jgi:membrane protein implicated in regulation of membrane protease activity
MNLLGNIFGFIVNLAVILGGLVCVTWFAGSLLVYGLLGRPMWEVAIVDLAASGVFIWFCVSVGRRRSSRDSARKLPDDDSRERLALRTAIGGIQAAGWKWRRRFSAFTGRLKESNAGLLGDEPLQWRLFTYFTIVISFMVPAFLILMIPMAMLAVTWEFCKAWAGGSEWMRSPGVMIAVIPGCLGLACVAVQFVSSVTSPDKPEIKKKSAGKKRRGKAGKDAGDSPEKTQATPSPPPPPG